MNSIFQTFEVFFTVQNREHQKCLWNFIVLQGGRSQPGVGKLNSKQHLKLVYDFEASPHVMTFITICHNSMNIPKMF